MRVLRLSLHVFSPPPPGCLLHPPCSPLAPRCSHPPPPTRSSDTALPHPINMLLLSCPAPHRPAYAQAVHDSASSNCVTDGTAALQPKGGGPRGGAEEEGWHHSWRADSSSDEGPGSGPSSTPERQAPVGAAWGASGPAALAVLSQALHVLLDPPVLTAPPAQAPAGSSHASGGRAGNGAGRATLRIYRPLAAQVADAAPQATFVVVRRAAPAANGAAAGREAAAVPRAPAPAAGGGGGGAPLAPPVRVCVKQSGLRVAEHVLPLAAGDNGASVR